MSIPRPPVVPAFHLMTAFIQIAILMSTLTAPLTTDIVCVALTIWAMRGPLFALQTLSMFVVIRAMNPSLIHWGTVSSGLGWALPFLLCIRLLPMMRSNDFKIMHSIFLFSFVTAFCSIIGSAALAVSITKIISFGLIVPAVLVANFRLNQTEVATLGRWLTTLAIAVAALSLITLLRPTVAHFSESNLLQGITNQPQTLGSYLAPFASGLLSMWLLQKSRATSGAFGFFGIMAVCILMTYSRNAVVATVLAVCLSFLKAKGAGARDETIASLSLLRVLTFGAIALIAMQLSMGGISKAVSGLVFKRGEESVGEAFSSSRGGGVVSQLKNFTTAPIVGHGFGVYVDGKFPAGVVSFAGIPISAPVEKGVLPTAVMEETGILGSTCFVYMIFVLVRTMWGYGYPPLMAIFLACLFLNFGEALLLSPGNIGLQLWLVIGWCLRAASTDSKVTDATSLVTTTSRAVVRPFSNLLD